MANNAIKAPFFRVLTSRSYCCQQKTNPVSGRISEVKTTILPNKVVVASSDTGSPIARLSVVFRAGSRYESVDNLGVTHALRIATGLSTKNSTQFAITRNIQQVGASLTCSTDREIVSYNLTGLQDAVQAGSEFLSDIATEQVFKPWELIETIPRIKLELATLPPEVKVIDMLHKAAYRRGLGNSLFIPKHQVGKISSETLQHYISLHLTSNRAAVVGLGVDHENLCRYAQNMRLQMSGGSDGASKYYGGEMRKHKGGSLAYVALANQSVEVCNQKESLAFALLQRVLGTGAYVKRGNEAAGLLFKSVSSSVGDCPVALSAFNAAYTDTGLIGFLAVAHSDVIRDVLKNAAATLRKPNITDSDFNRGKNQLIASTYMDFENAGNFINEMATQALLNATVQTPEQIVNIIQRLTIADVKKAAEKASASKWSMAAFGNLSNVPYLDEI